MRIECCHCFFVLSRSYALGAAVFQPQAQKMDALSSCGILDVRATEKHGNVDDLMTRMIRDYIRNFAKHPDPAPHQRLAVVLSGDDDFGPSLRALREAGFRMSADMCVDMHAGMRTDEHQACATHQACAVGKLSSRRY